MILLKNLFTNFGGLAFISEMGITVTGALVLIISFIILVMLDRRYSLPDSAYVEKGGAEIRSGTTAYLIWAVAVAWMILLAGDGASSFIYFQF